jgi:hypothetical protein
MRYKHFFRYFIFLFLILLFFIGCHSNLFFSKNKNYKYANSDFLDSMKIEPIDYNTVLIELRIWYYNWSNGKDKLIQVTQKKDTIWTCTIHEFYFYNDSHYNFHSIPKCYPLGNSWIETWKIINQNYIHLPNQQNLEQKNKFKKLDKLTSGDGNDYTIEFLSNKSKHKFSFYNPEIRYNYYKKNGMEIKEYKEYMALIDLLNKGLNLELPK